MLMEHVRIDGLVRFYLKALDLLVSSLSGRPVMGQPEVESRHSLALEGWKLEISMDQLLTCKRSVFLLCLMHTCAILPVQAPKDWRGEEAHISEQGCAEIWADWQGGRGDGVGGGI